MTDHAWKQVERKLARLFGVERNQDTHGPDFITALFVAEVKHGKQVKPLKGLYRQAWDEAREYSGANYHEQLETLKEEMAYDWPDYLPPVAFLHEKGQKVNDSWVVMKAGDLAHILAKARGNDGS